MFAKPTKVLVAALVLAATSLTFVANAHAAPVNTQSQAEQTWMNRASNTFFHFSGKHSLRNRSIVI